MTAHELLTIDAAPRSLHPVETILVSAALARGRHVRVCRCMTVLVGNNACDVFAMFTEHRRAVEQVSRG